MIINNVRISEDKLAALMNVMQEVQLREEYVKSEITTDLIYKLPKKYRDNQQPSLIGNDLEGSTTEESLNSKEHGGNSYQNEVTYSDMPGTCNCRW